MTDGSGPRGPVRTCVACRRRAPAALLVRVRVLEGAPGPRLATGPGPGRGAWLCQGNDCVEEALRGSRLARALRRPALPPGGDELRGALAATPPGPGSRAPSGASIPPPG